ncbi:hypothetical protein [Acinetobacter lanii]|uniref:hypothetical protein n=1 Tax=Acinetobacter lanii TaxID=2715163 RepID=UPI001D0ED38D|nr:hypothetical protein [Acinetobacter lanii]
MIAFLCLCLGFITGYLCRARLHPPLQQEKTKKAHIQGRTQLQRIYLKSMHQSDSDRIRELNLLNSNQSVFLRLLKHTFSEYEIAIKQ